MNPEEMKKRTQDFALRIIRLVERLPRGLTAQIIGKQLLRCGTSVGANYRSSCRSKSNADFISKMRIVEEEADECSYWMDLLVGSGLVPLEKLSMLQDEANQIVAITVASIKTARKNSAKMSE